VLLTKIGIFCQKEKELLLAKPGKTLLAKGGGFAKANASFFKQIIPD
jgi:hypothetical protein